MLIALDYDGTYTADPALWLSFIITAQSRGHEVWIVTMRDEFELDDARRVPGRHCNDGGLPQQSVNPRQGGARKADDCYSVWGCAACHAWLDSGPAPKAEKTAAFARAHADQVLAWRAIATGMEYATDRQRRAAQWALEQLNAVPEIAA